MNNIEPIIEKLIEDRQEFNIMTVENIAGAKFDTKVKNKILDLCVADDRLIKFFLTMCPECGIKNNDGLLMAGILSEKKQCFQCKKKYVVSYDNTMITFDAKSLTERFKNQ